MRVFVRGYEGGLDDPVLRTELVDLDTHDSSVYGPHAIHDEGWDEPSETVDGLIIDRPGR